MNHSYLHTKMKKFTHCRVGETEWAHLLYYGSVHTVLAVCEQWFCAAQKEAKHIVHPLPQDTSGYVCTITEKIKVNLTPNLCSTMLEPDLGSIYNHAKLSFLYNDAKLTYNLPALYPNSGSKVYRGSKLLLCRLWCNSYNLYYTVGPPFWQYLVWPCPFWRWVWNATSVLF